MHEDPMFMTPTLARALITTKPVDQRSALAASYLLELGDHPGKGVLTMVDLAIAVATLGSSDKNVYKLLSKIARLKLPAESVDTVHSGLQALSSRHLLGKSNGDLRRALDILYQFHSIGLASPADRARTRELLATYQLRPASTTAEQRLMRLLLAKKAGIASSILAAGATLGFARGMRRLPPASRRKVVMATGLGALLLRAPGLRAQEVLTEARKMTWWATFEAELAARRARSADVLHKADTDWASRWWTDLLTPTPPSQVPPAAHRASASQAHVPVPPHPVTPPAVSDAGASAPRAA